MSLNYPQKLKTCAISDPRLVIQNEREYAVFKSPQSTLYKQFTTTSINNASLTFSCPTPSASVVCDRKVLLYVPIRLTLNGLCPIGNTLLNVSRSGPRAFGLLKSLQSIIATINNQTVSLNCADIIGALLHYNTDDILKDTEYSITPTSLDQSQEYTSLQGSTRSPLSLYWDSVQDSVMPNGGFCNYRIISNPASTSPTVPVTAVVDIAFCENLMLAPFLWGKKNAGGWILPMLEKNL